MMPETSEWVNAAEVGGLQNALDLLPATGGTVHLPAGRYEIADPVVKQLAEGQHLHLVGDGRATVLVNRGEDGADMLRLT